jgi:hypothetical protein
MPGLQNTAIPLDRPTEPVDGMAEDPLGGIPEKAVGLADALLEHLTDLVRLQAYRVEKDIRSYVLRLLAMVGCGAIALAGLIFLASGAISELTLALGSEAGAYALIGGACLLIGVVGVWIAARGGRVK